MNAFKLIGVFALVLGISNVFADSIKLKNGDQLQGKVTAQSDESVEFSHDVLGTLSILRADITELKTDEQPVAEKPEDDGLISSGFLIGWNRALTVALSGSEGVTTDAKFHIDFKADYEDASDRWIFATAYNMKSDDSQVTDNNFYASLDKDWLIPDSPWFWFVRGRYDWDEFKDWDHRIGGHVGPAYQFLDNDIWNLRGRSGIGGKYTWGGVDPGLEAEILLGLDLGWTIAENQSLKASTTLYPSVENWGEYRNISTLDWKIDVSEFYHGIGLTLGLNNEYDSQGLSTDSDYDLKYHFGIIMGL